MEIYERHPSSTCTAPAPNPRRNQGSPRGQNFSLFSRCIPPMHTALTKHTRALAGSAKYPRKRAGTRASGASVRGSTAGRTVKMLWAKATQMSRHQAKKGFVLLSKRWVLGRSFGPIARFRRLTTDDERLPQVLAGLHFLVFAILMLPNAILFITDGTS